MTSKKMQKEEEECHTFFKSILQIISLGTDAEFGRYGQAGRSWEV